MIRPVEAEASKSKWSTKGMRVSVCFSVLKNRVADVRLRKIKTASFRRHAAKIRANHPETTSRRSRFRR